MSAACLLALTGVPCLLTMAGKSGVQPQLFETGRQSILLYDCMLSGELYLLQRHAQSYGAECVLLH